MTTANFPVANEAGLATPAATVNPILPVIAAANSLLTQTNGLEGPVVPEGLTPLADSSTGPNTSSINNPSAFPEGLTGTPTHCDTLPTENHTMSQTESISAAFAPQTTAPFSSNACQPAAPASALPTIALLSPNTPQLPIPVGTEAISFITPLVSVPYTPPPVAIGSGAVSTLDPMLSVPNPVHPPHVPVAENRKATKMCPTSSNTARCEFQFHW